MTLSRTLGVSLSIGLVLVACTTERPAAHDGVTTEALSSGNLYGNSLPWKTLALTFDDGPGDRTAELSSYLAAQGIQAAFFVNGGRIASTTLPGGPPRTANANAILAQLAADGHLVANHTVTHRDLVNDVLPTGAAFVSRELSETDADIAGYVPSNHFLFRPPFGSYSQAVFNALAPTSMNKYVGPINWDIGGTSNNYPAQAADWACWQNQLQGGGGGATFGVTTKQCGDAYLTEIGAVGHGIVLMHDPYFSAIGSTVDMIKYVVPILKANGYSFRRADEVPAIAALLAVPACAVSCATCTAGGACASCRGGTYLAAGACLVCSGCGDGTYMATACSTVADTACAPCAASCATCSGAASHCTSCPGGTYLSAGACLACSGCGAGSYARAACSATHDTTCAPCAVCAAGSYAQAACSATHDTDCAPCTACAAGSYAQTACAPTHDAICAPCTACAAGSYAQTACAPTHDAICAACSAGTFSAAAGAGLCTACAPGSFAGAAGATACNPCGAGTIAPAAGQTACSACAPGQIAAGGGAATCSACDAGSFAAAGAVACTLCPAGTSADAGAAACTACAPGTYAEEGKATCQACAPGSFAASAGATTCAPCTAGTFAASSGAAACARCAPGSHAAGPGATACATCGGCDDGDRCTTDTCDEVKGCVHTPASCPPDAGPPGVDVPDGSAAPWDGSGPWPDAPGSAPADTAAPGRGDSGGCAAARSPRAEGRSFAGLGLAMGALGLALARRRRATA